MLVLERLADYAAWRRQTGPASVGFVPTMGALHAGHAELIRKARAACEHVVVSIFVNPLQFGPNEDFERYPRTFQEDVALCRELGADVVFHPAVCEIYPRPLEQMTRVCPPAELIGHLCGSFRPGHFQGVATVVLKLFQIVQPTTAFFGEKDYQQLAVIRRMVADLQLNVQVQGVPTVREEDGLARSSRNVYLSDAQRKVAPVLHRTISSVLAKTLSAGIPLQTALAEARAGLEAVNGISLQYLEACDADTLEPLAEARRPMVILVAAKLGDVRLIDNVIAV